MAGDEPDHGEEHRGASDEVEESDGANAVEGHERVVCRDAEREQCGAPCDQRENVRCGLGDLGAGEKAENAIAEGKKEGGADGDEQQVGQKCAEHHLAELAGRG